MVPLTGMLPQWSIQPRHAVQCDEQRLTVRVDQQLRPGDLKEAPLARVMEIKIKTSVFVEHGEGA